MSANFSSRGENAEEVVFHFVSQVVYDIIQQVRKEIANCAIVVLSFNTYEKCVVNHSFYGTYRGTKSMYNII